MKRRLRSVIFMVLIILVGFYFITNLNIAEAKDKVKDYITWLGSYENRDSIPLEVEDFGVYFDKEEGSSYIYDGAEWQLFAAKGADGKDADDELIKKLVLRMESAEAQIADLTSRLSIAEAALEEFDYSGLIQRIEALEADPVCLLTEEELNEMKLTLSSLYDDFKHSKMIDYRRGVEFEYGGAVADINGIFEFRVSIIDLNRDYVPYLLSDSFGFTVGQVISAEYIGYGEYIVRGQIDTVGVHELYMIIEHVGIDRPLVVRVPES